MQYISLFTPVWALPPGLFASLQHCATKYARGFRRLHRLPFPFIVPCRVGTRQTGAGIQAPRSSMPNRLVCKESHDRLIYYEWHAQALNVPGVFAIFFSRSLWMNRAVVHPMSIVHPPRLVQKMLPCPQNANQIQKIITGRHYFSNDAPAYHSIEVDMTPTRPQATEKE